MTRVFSLSACANAGGARNSMAPASAARILGKSMSGSFTRNGEDAAPQEVQIAELVTRFVVLGSEHTQGGDDSFGLLIRDVDRKRCCVGESLYDRDGNRVVIRKARPELLLQTNADPQHRLDRQERNVHFYGRAGAV